MKLNGFSCFFSLADIPDSLDSKDENEDCDETISIVAGCDIVNRRCKCWDQMQVCKYHKIRWDFKNMEVSATEWNLVKNANLKIPVTFFFLLLQECQLNLQNVVKNELDFDEDYTIPPQNFGE